MHSWPADPWCKREKRRHGIWYAGMANAYASIVHKLMEIALIKHCVSGRMKDFMLDYYNSLRVTTRTVTPIEKGIIGCTVSVSLFALAMNMLIKLEEEACWGPVSRSGIWQLPVSMDTRMQVALLVLSLGKAFDRTLKNTTVRWQKHGYHQWTSCNSK